MSPTSIIVLLTILTGACLTLVGLQVALWRTYTTGQAAALTRIARLTTTVETLTQQLALVGQQVMPISLAYQAILVKELTHFHTPELDALLAKLGPPFLLTDEEETALLDGLRAREQDMEETITDSERDAAHILPAIIKRVKRERNPSPVLPSFFQTVLIPALHSGDESA